MSLLEREDLVRKMYVCFQCERGFSERHLPETCEEEKVKHVK